MSDYRYNISDHNGIRCLHVVIGIDEDADASLAQTNIPLDDILNSVKVSLSEVPNITPIPVSRTGDYVRINVPMPFGVSRRMAQVLAFDLLRVCEGEGE